MRRIQPLHFFNAIAIISIIMLSISPGEASAQCYGSLALYPGFFEYDYLVRYCVHFGDISQIPEDIECSISRNRQEDIVEVPIYCYNAHEGVSYMEFALQSNDSILSFSPQNGITVNYSTYDIYESSYQMNLTLAAPSLCGPFLVGYLYIAPGAESDLTWINIVANRHTQRMYTWDAFSRGHYAFTPHHGGYIGDSCLFTCQQPLCEEPNMPVTELVAQAGYASSVKLTWTAGSGNYTIIRARTDRFPSGYLSGRLVVEMETVPGQEYYFFDTDIPDLAIIYYVAWSLTIEEVSKTYPASPACEGEIVETSFVECGATDTTFVHHEIAAEKMSWGRIKSLGKE
ncbi:MAG: hypothetical protein JW814_03765 [Candidatus Krumholzibacteriota bacterium]|nr:hypothetical protein [Candidatus Krumholzibacteriota bacterium]